MKSTTIENGINRALSTGDFSIKQSTTQIRCCTGIKQTHICVYLSHSRRISTPLEKAVN